MKVNNVFKQCPSHFCSTAVRAPINTMDMIDLPYPLC
jgi:hypothetical protein